MQFNGEEISRMMKECGPFYPTELLYQKSNNWDPERVYCHCIVLLAQTDRTMDEYGIYDDLKNTSYRAQLKLLQLMRETPREKFTAPYIRPFVKSIYDCMDFCERATRLRMISDGYELAEPIKQSRRKKYDHR